MAALLTMFTVIVIALLINRIATLALIQTGMSRDIARFQARSALTGVGFTTSEAEAVVNNPARRRIVMLLMLVGNAGLVTVIGSFAFTFADSDDEVEFGIRLGAIIAALVVLILLSNSDAVDRALAPFFKWILRKWGASVIRDYERLLELGSKYEINSIQVSEKSDIVGKGLGDIGHNDRGLVVLGVRKADGEYIGAPADERIIEANDTLILYGESSRLQDFYSASQAGEE